MHFPQTTIYSICSHCGGEGSWAHRVTSGKSIIPSWGDSQAFISVFLDFPAGRNLQPKARWWCKGGISPPQPCSQATVVIRGSGGFGAPLLLPTKGSSASHSLWNPSQDAFPARHQDVDFSAAIPWKAPRQNLDELDVCILLKVLTEQVLSPPFTLHPRESHNQTSLAAL